MTYGEAFGHLAKGSKRIFVKATLIRIRRLMLLQLRAADEVALVGTDLMMMMHAFYCIAWVGAYVPSKKDDNKVSIFFVPHLILILLLHFQVKTTSHLIPFPTLIMASSRLFHSV